MLSTAEKKLRNSAVRNSIYEYLCGTKEHPSAEMIYNDLKGDNPNLSLGTVYRNLKQLDFSGAFICLLHTIRFQSDVPYLPHAYSPACIHFFFESAHSTINPAPTEFFFPSASRTFSVLTKHDAS